MTHLDQKSVEAAIKVYADIGGRRGIKAAITAYHKAIEPQLRERVSTFEGAALAFSICNSAPIDEFRRKEAAVEEARADLYALFGLEAE